MMVSQQNFLSIFLNELAPFLLDVYDAFRKTWHHAYYFQNKNQHDILHKKVGEKGVVNL